MAGSLLFEQLPQHKLRQRVVEAFGALTAGLRSVTGFKEVTDVFPGSQAQKCVPCWGQVTFILSVLPECIFVI